MVGQVMRNRLHDFVMPASLRVYSCLWINPVQNAAVLALLGQTAEATEYP